MYAPLPELREEIVLRPPSARHRRRTDAALRLRVDPVVVAAAILLALAGVWLTREGPRVTPDSMHYLSAAQHLARGDGLTSAITPLEDPRLTAPLTPWPPLYPTLLGALSGMGVGTPLDAARIVNAAAALAAVLGVGALGALAGGRWVGRATAIFYATSFTAGLLTSFVWSEALFVALLVWGYLFVAGGLFRRGGFPWESLLGGLLLALGGLSRYIGVAAVGAGALAAMALTLHEGRRRALLAGVLVLLPGVLLDGAWLLSNHRLTGFWFGEPRPPGTTGLDEGLVDAAIVLVRDFLAPVARVEGMSPWLAYGPAAIATLVLAALVAGGPASIAPPRFDRRSGVWLLVLVAALAHVAAVLHSVNQVKLDPVNTRYLAPAYPFVLILLVLASRSVAFSERRREGRELRRALAAVVVTLLILPQAAATITLGRRVDREERVLTAPYWTSTLGSPSAWRADPGLARAAALARPDAPVLSNAWERVTIATALPVKPLPEPHQPDLLRRITAFPGALLAIHRPTRPYRLTAEDVRGLIAYGAPIEPLGETGAWTFFRVHDPAGAAP